MRLYRESVSFHVLREMLCDIAKLQRKSSEVHLALVSWTRNFGFRLQGLLYRRRRSCLVVSVGDVKRGDGCEDV